MTRCCLAALWLILAAATGCAIIAPPTVAPPTVAPPTVMPSPTRGTVAPVASYRVIAVYPHDRDAFTQGLVYLDDFLYESTGLYGRATLRKVDLASGRVLQMASLLPEYFGEGIAVWGERIVQLTWREEIGFLYNRTSFAQVDAFHYPGEGWGLTHDGVSLIMSDGTAALRFLDPDTLRETGRLQVHDGGRPVIYLNELEYIRGEVWVNVWPTDRIARIAPATGEVLSWIDLSGLLSPEERRQADVLNGIAYDAEGDRLFVTGKLWPKLFEIEVVQQLP